MCSQCSPPYCVLIMGIIYMTAWQSAFVTCHQDWFQQHRLRLNDYSWSSWDGWPESTGYFWYQLLHDIDDMILVADVAATWCGILTLSLHVSRETMGNHFPWPVGIQMLRREVVGVATQKGLETNLFLYQGPSDKILHYVGCEKP